MAALEGAAVVAADVDRYRNELGRDPARLDADDPLAWQWEYRGRSREDKDRLADFLQDRDPGDESDVVLDGQESLL